MTLPIHRILWAGNDAAHDDHLHVEGTPYIYGRTTGAGTQPPLTNPGMTTSIRTVWDAMSTRYGTGYYFLDTPPPEPNWSTMGIYNRRPVAGSTLWSQHAWSNALDIGPLNGVAKQRPIYDYLTTWEDDEMTAEQLAQILAAIGKTPREVWAYEPGIPGVSAHQIQLGIEHRTRLLVGALPDMTTFDDDELAQIAKAVNDEQHRRSEG